MPELTDIGTRMSREWSTKERIDLSNKYKAMWSDDDRAAVKRAALDAGLNDAYRGCYTGKNQTFGDLADCFEREAESANIEGTYEGLWR